MARNYAVYLKTYGDGVDVVAVITKAEYDEIQQQINNDIAENNESELPDHLKRPEGEIIGEVLESRFGWGSGVRFAPCTGRQQVGDDYIR